MKKFAAVAVAAVALGLGGCAVVPAEPAVVVSPGVVYGPPAVVERPRYRHRHHHHHRHHGWRG